MVGKNKKAAKEESTVAEVSLEEEETSKVGHNYTECCQQRNVSSACWGFCTLKDILDGTPGQNADLCEPDFPDIVKCMAGNDF